MIDIKRLRENTEYYKKAVEEKGRNVDIDKVVVLDAKFRDLNLQIESLRAKQNRITKENQGEGIKLKQEIKELSQKIEPVGKELTLLLNQIPNPAAEYVPIGDESSNKIVKKIGDVPKFDFDIKDHVQLGASLNILDFEKATKVSGSRFVLLKNDGALLEQAIFRYVIDKLIKKGFDFILPPHMINSKSMKGMGYLEHGGDSETYYLPKDDMYLIGTSEHILGAIMADEVFNEKDLPYRVCAFSPCYRREAGSYGKDTKGMLRVHQFDKVEMFSFTTPEKSKDELEYILAIEEEIATELELPYQVVLIASRDLGDPAAAKYDIESWFPGQNKYREITSCSTTTDFQSRRLNIRYKNNDGKLNFVHTLNGTGASTRPFIAILENYQQKDGSVRIPKILIPYFGKEEIVNANHN